MTKRKRTKGQTTILRYYLKGTIFEKKKTVYKLFQNRFKLLMYVAIYLQSPGSFEVTL
jgi:hypothetical protein